MTSIREKVARALHAQTAKMQGKFPIPPYEHDTTGFYVDMGTVSVAAFLEAAAEKGWHMRPDEATEEMEKAGFKTTLNRAMAREIYCSMLVSAPEFKLDN